MAVAIYHNPDCGTSRDVLAIIEAPATQDRLPPGPFQKEDGQLLIDHDGRRIA